MYSYQIPDLGHAPTIGDAPMLAGGELYRVVDRVVFYSGAGQLQVDGPFSMRVREVTLYLELIPE